MELKALPWDESSQIGDNTALDGMPEFGSMQVSAASLSSPVAFVASPESGAPNATTPDVAREIAELLALATSPEATQAELDRAPPQRVVSTWTDEIDDSPSGGLNTVAVEEEIAELLALAQTPDDFSEDTTHREQRAAKPRATIQPRSEVVLPSSFDPRAAVLMPIPPSSARSSDLRDPTAAQPIERSIPVVVGRPSTLSARTAPRGRAVAAPSHRETWLRPLTTTWRPAHVLAAAALSWVFVGLGFILGLMWASSNNQALADPQQSAPVQEIPRDNVTDASPH